MIRFFDVLLSFAGILFFFPILVTVYVIIILESKGGGLYIQKRVGLNGVDFNLLKFRSMIVDSDKKSLITVGNKDPRITKIGYFIRKYKIDELPQLFNVLIGDMSLVGPRPEVRKYVDLYTTEQKKVLQIKPGITDYASIEYADENKILGLSSDPDSMYVHEIMPVKIRLSMKYVESKSILEYFKIIFLTFYKIVSN